MHLCNWMKDLGDETSLKDLNIPGTHDSSTEFCTLSLFSSCQKTSIAEQLEMGVRAFDIRVNGMNVVHAFCKCKKSFLGKNLLLSDVLESMFSFLEKNPTETILMLYKMDGGKDSKKCFSLLYESFIKENPDKWYLENKIPSLGQVRGKIVVLRRTDSDKEKSGINFTLMPDQGGTDSTDSGEFSPNGEDRITVQDRYNILRKRKWSGAVKPLFENEKDFKETFVLNYLSTAAFPIIPRFNAGHINKKFLAYHLEKSGHYGTLMFDFVIPELAEKLIKTNKNL